MSGFSTWAEFRWHFPDLDWRKAKVITAGVDVGSVSTQAVVMVDGQLYCYSNIHTGSESGKSAQKAMEWALEQTSLTLEKIHYIVGTGYGRVNVPFANRTVTEIACHAKGQLHLRLLRFAPFWIWAGRIVKSSVVTRKGRSCPLS